jgi:hypothetical protein
MPKMSKSKPLNTFPHDSVPPASAEDVLVYRLDQCAGVLVAIENSYDDEDRQYGTPAPYIRAALDGVFEMLNEARRAADHIVLTKAAAASAKIVRFAGKSQSS